MDNNDPVRTDFETALAATRDSKISAPLAIKKLTSMFFERSTFGNPLNKREVGYLILEIEMHATRLAIAEHAK